MKKKNLIYISICLFFLIVIVIAIFSMIDDKRKRENFQLNNETIGGYINTVIKQLTSLNDILNKIVKDIEKIYTINNLSVGLNTPISILYNNILKILPLNYGVIESNILQGTTPAAADAAATTTTSGANANTKIKNRNIINDPEWPELKYTLNELILNLNKLDANTDIYLAIIPDPLSTNYDASLKDMIKLLSNLKEMINQNKIYISDLLKY